MQPQQMQPQMQPHIMLFAGQQLQQQMQLQMQPATTSSDSWWPCESASIGQGLPAGTEKFGTLRPATEMISLRKIAPTFCNALNALPVDGFDTNKDDYITKTLRWAVCERGCEVQLAIALQGCSRLGRVGGGSSW
jgi:hypothetical protein